VLLPGADGMTGALIVRQGESENTLDAPFASAAAGADGKPRLLTADPAAVRSQFAAVLRALPAAPASYTVYFVFGRDELTDDSRQAIKPLLEEVTRRPAPEIAVTGHADQAGPDAVNDALSRRRAERVRDMLVELGIPATRITVAGRGAREPAVRGLPGQSDPRNRRVEISVR